MDVIDGRPFFLENVEANIARHIDVGMIHRRKKCDMWCSVGISRRKGERQFERETSIWLQKVRIMGPKTGNTESGGPDIIASHSKRLESVLGKAEIPGALAIYTLVLPRSDGPSAALTQTAI